MADISITEVTDGTITGEGVFDTLMSSVESRLLQQYQQGRIKGSDYANVYLGSMQAAMQQAIAFVLGKQQADKQAELLAQQTQALISETAIKEAQSAKDLLVKQEQIDASQAETIIKQTQSAKDIEVKAQQISASINQESVRTSANTKDNLVKDNQITKLQKEYAAIESEMNIKVAQSAKDLLVKDEQIAKLQEEQDFIIQQRKSEIAKILDTVDAVPVTGLIGAQVEKTDAEKFLLEQKKKTEMAQILDTVDEVAVAGVVAKQKNLYGAQADGFTRDAEQKAAKAIGDIWSIAKTSDIATNNPQNINQAEMDKVIKKLATGIGVTLTYG